MKRRTLILAVAALFAVLAYGLALRFSPVIVRHVVEQTLIQKAPEGASRSEIKTRFRANMEAITDDHARLQRLLSVSQYLEKVQRLRAEELDGILSNTPIGSEENIR